MFDKKKYHAQWSKEHKSNIKRYARKTYLKNKIKIDEYRKQWRKDHIEKVRESSRRYYAKHGRIKTIDELAALAEWKKNHPEVISAHNKVNWAIKTGKLKRPTLCSKCKQNKKIDAHHPDYKKPLEVLWLCISCHRLLHRPT